MTSQRWFPPQHEIISYFYWYFVSCQVSNCWTLTLQGYFFLSPENRHKILLSLAKEYDLNRTQVRELMKQHLDLQLPSGGSCFHSYECVFFVTFILLVGFRSLELWQIRLKIVVIMKRKDLYLLSTGLSGIWGRLSSLCMKFFSSGSIHILGDWSSCLICELIFFIFSSKVMSQMKWSVFAFYGQTLSWL